MIQAMGRVESAIKRIKQPVTIIRNDADFNAHIDKYVRN
jgi:hypothetical protein